MADLDNRIQFLSSCRLDIFSSIDRLKKRHAELMKELSQVEQDLKIEEHLPDTIAAMQEQSDSIARQARALRS
jgi:hypothetical protein